MDSIRLLLADDHPLFIEGLLRVIDNKQDIECIAIAKNGIEAVELARQNEPDIALLDVDMPLMNGLEAARIIKNEFETMAVAIVSAFRYDDYIRASIKYDLDGYMVKTMAPSDLIDSLYSMHAGEAVFHHKATSSLMRSILNKSHLKDTKPASSLSSRELEVLNLLGKGVTNKTIAKELNISEGTVATHIFNIFKKLEVTSRTEAVLRGLKVGIIDMNNVP